MQRIGLCSQTGIGALRPETRECALCGDRAALLADFGIARLTDAATATMVGAGTPAYMAP